MTYGDTSDKGNGGNYEPVGLRITLVRDNVMNLATDMAAGDQIDLATVDPTQIASVQQLLLISNEE